MYIRTPRFNALFENSIQKLASNGVSVNPYDAVTIFELCKDVVDVSNREEFYEPILEIGELRFHLLTVGAVIWLERYCGRWFYDDKRMDFLCIAYASHNARNPDALTKITNARQCEDIVLKWALHLPCTLDVLTSKLNDFLEIHDGINIKGIGEIENRESKSVQYSSIIARVSVDTGIKPQELLWTMTTNQLAAMLVKYNDGKNTDADLAVLRLQSYLKSLENSKQ